MRNRLLWTSFLVTTFLFVGCTKKDKAIEPDSKAASPSSALTPNSPSQNSAASNDSLKFPQGLGRPNSISDAIDSAVQAKTDTNDSSISKSMATTGRLHRKHHRGRRHHRKASRRRHRASR